MISTGMPVPRLISFGFLHLPKAPGGQPVLPAADRIEDVREVLRDPAAARAILDLDGHDLRVQQVVLDTPGARGLLDDLTAYVLRSPASPRTLAIGCSGGKHRACALVVLMSQVLRTKGLSVDTQHLHAHLPRVLKAS
jgi:RNase adaptor protein for sRNA GlmZ degradation